MADLKKKYKPMENVLNSINASIALQDKEKKRNNRILHMVTNTVIERMKKTDNLFNSLFEKNFYGGSYYDNLKVGNPNEYDLDLVMNLPVIVEPRVVCSTEPGFVHVEVSNYDKIKKESSKRSKQLDTLLENYKNLSTIKVFNWVESILIRALNKMPKVGLETYVDIDIDEKKLLRIFVKVSKGPPAFTMRLTGRDIDGTDILLDVDLVPCFQFSEKHWPSKKNGYRKNPSAKKTKFLVVPKKPKDPIIEKSSNVGIYWRLSFQEQERELIGQDLKTLKPTIRLLKKLRDKHNHKIASYFIKTVFLWTLDEEPKSFWIQPLSVVTMMMLRKYAECISKMYIPYYWNKNFNLIKSLQESTKIDIANTLQKILANIERNLNPPLIDPFVMGRYLLSSDGMSKLKADIALSKKIERDRIKACVQMNTYPPDTTDGPPMEKLLKFSPIFTQLYKEYSDFLERSKK